MYAPLRLELDTELSVISKPVESNSSTIQIDIGKVFKGKTDKKLVFCGTVNPLYTDSRYNNKIRYIDNLNVTKHSLKR